VILKWKIILRRKYKQSQHEWSQLDNVATMNEVPHEILNTFAKVLTGNYVLRAATFSFLAAFCLHLSTFA